MHARENVARGGVLEQLTLPELIDLWAEDEIERRLQEIEFHHESIVGGARSLPRLQVMPQRGGFHEGPRSIEVLVEVRDRVKKRTRIGAWEEAKSANVDSSEAFQRAYEKATAHAIVQLLPAAVWRPWIHAAAER